MRCCSAWMSVMRVRERVARAAHRMWQGDGGPALELALLLAPFEGVYRAVVAVRNRAYDAGVLRAHRAAVPVITIGNIAVGGSGKTPFAAWIADSIEERGLRSAILHGGRTADEPALHAHWNPERIVVARPDRVAGAAEAAARGAQLLVLDDGFQHRRLARDLDIVLIAAERWRARRPLLPRGPWREPASSLKRAGLIVVTRKSAPPERAAAVEADIRRILPGKPTARVALVPDGWRRGGAPSDPPGGEVFAVAGVADPDSFLHAARAAGADVAGLMAFPDHHAYDDADLQRIRAAAGGRPIVTTEKDWMRLAVLLAADEAWLLAQTVEVESGREAIVAALDRVAAVQQAGERAQDSLP